MWVLSLPRPLRLAFLAAVGAGILAAVLFDVVVISVTATVAAGPWGPGEGAFSLASPPTGGVGVGPAGFAADRRGNVFILDLGNRRIHVFDGRGRRLPPLPTAQLAATDLAVSAGALHLLLAEGARVVRLERDGPREVWVPPVDAEAPAVAAPPSVLGRAIRPWPGDRLLVSEARVGDDTYLHRFWIVGADPAGPPVAAWRLRADGTVALDAGILPVVAHDIMAGGDLIYALTAPEDPYRRTILIFDRRGRPRGSLVVESGLPVRSLQLVGTLAEGILVIGLNLGTPDGEIRIYRGPTRHQVVPAPQEPGYALGAWARAGPAGEFYLARASSAGFELRRIRRERRLVWRGRGGRGG